MNEIRALMKRDPRDLPCPFHYVRTYVESFIYEPEGRNSPDTETSIY
jgi:hypothetical protein